VDAIKKFLYRRWTDEATMQASVKSLLTRIARLAPEEQPAEQPATTAKEATPTVAAEARGTAAPETRPTAASEPVVDAEAGKDAEPEIVVGKRGEPAGLPQSKSVRIALERLDQMMNAVGELVINRTRMLGRLAELEKLADVLNFSKARMSDKVAEFQEKYEFSLLTSGTMPGMGNGKTRAEARGTTQKPASRDPYPFRRGFSSYSNVYDASLAEFSELEMDRYDDFSILSRSLTEISADITEVLTQLDGFVRRVDGDIDEFTKLAHRLQDEITQARMVPIGNLYTRLTRTVRDAAKATAKRVELSLAGAETELDNNIIQQISDPLIHLVRNAVAHGIERADERYLSGKSDQGNIAVRAYHRGNHIYIEVEDDGRGIDYERVRATAIEAGLATTQNAASLTERQLLEFLFHPGFTTAPRKTELAGRGVGLDVVRSNVTALNGEVDVETRSGLGTRFTLKVPLTLIISQALFVRCGHSMFALPLAFVEEIRRLRAADLIEKEGKLATKIRDVTMEVVRLDAQLALPKAEPVNGYYRLVIVNVSGRQVGLLVEEVVRKDEIVIKNLGEYLRNVKIFPGATIAPDGRLILLIDVNRLVAGEAIEHRPLMTVANAARVFAPGAIAVASGEIPAGAIEPALDEKVIVLADDSISVRKFVGRMLEKAGYRVKLAADGLEALEIATQTSCNLVVTDLEMPRTNGYELMAHLRQQPETAKLPVLVVTSRAGAKHRERAMKEGASAFLVKPVQEEHLLAVIMELIGPAGTKKNAAALAGTHGA
jgi:chemosensory pili system protein ChpA (sensor histidine kinase/response regulator)